MRISRDQARAATPVLAAVGLVVLVTARVVAARRDDPPRPPESFSVPLPAGPDDASPFEVDGTHIRVRKADGSVATDAEFVGAVLVAQGQAGAKQAYRIDTVEPDPLDRSGEIVLYGLSTRDASGAWTAACLPDARGVQRGFPIAGVWTEKGVHLPSPGRFEVACTSGAHARCVRLGYRPWKSRDLWDRHQACTRLLVADYCGDGVSHTRDDAPIHLFDAAGIQPDADAPGMRFEAGWGVDGAVCVSRTRAPSLFSLEQLRASCPERLPVIGEACTEERAKRDPRALLFSKSSS